MTLPKLDGFTGTSGTLIHTYDANWVAARTGAAGSALTWIFGNQIATNDTSALSGMWLWSGDTFGTAQYAQCRISALDVGGDTYQGPSVRLGAGANAGYTIDSANGDRYLESLPSFATLFHDTGALAVNNVQRIEASGSSITYKVGATTLSTVTDATFASGAAGFMYFGTASSNGKLDDFEGGNLSAGATTVIPNAIATAESVYQPTVKLSLLPNAIATAESVYQPTLTTAQMVLPNTIATLVQVHAPTVSTIAPGAVNPGAIASGEFVYVPAVKLQALPGSIATLESVYQPTVSFASIPSITVQPGTIATAAQLFVPNLGRPLRSVAPPGLLVGYALVGFGGGDTSESLNNLPDLNVYGPVAGREYNAAEPENSFKWESLHYASGVYDFAESDVSIAFVQAHTQVMAATGPLVWGQSIPSWVTSGSWTPTTATAMMYDHIDHVVGRYVGQVHSWEVVNEPINNTTFWPGVIGGGYIDLAFRRAHAADPGAILITNEYNCEELNSTSNAYYSLVSGLVSGGTPINGVGFEFHISGALNWSSVASNFARFAALGLQIYITELDVRIPDPPSPTDLTSQAAVYTSVAQTALAQPAVKGISTWGFTDKYSWVPSSFPGTGAALPFDQNYQAKPAYLAIRDALAAAPLTLSPSGIASVVQVFAPNITTVIPGTIQPNTISSGQVLYSPTVRVTQIVQPPSVPSAEQVYVPGVVLVVPQTTFPNTVTSGESVYGPIVGSYIPPLVVSPDTIPSAARAYAPTVTRQRVEAPPLRPSEETTVPILRLVSSPPAPTLVP